jgi:hypothetical protein
LTHFLQADPYPCSGQSYAKREGERVRDREKERESGTNELYLIREQGS